MSTPAPDTSAQVERTHAITVAGPVDRVFVLFTPLGEKLWVRGWEPEFLHPLDGKTARFMVFRTGVGPAETLWTCTDWQPRSHVVRYVRVTPASRFGFVEVQARSLAAAVTEVCVTYRYVALTPSGAVELAAFTDVAFREMIDGWRVAADRWLADNPHAELTV